MIHEKRSIELAQGIQDRTHLISLALPLVRVGRLHNSTRSAATLIRQSSLIRIEMCIQRSTLETHRLASQAGKPANLDLADLPRFANDCELLQMKRVGGEGLEPPTPSV